MSKIVYKIRNSLYLNITNKCSNECSFCVRKYTDVIKGYNLKLEKEPSVKDVLNAVKEVTEYDEAVFCGYGEPTARLAEMLEIAKHLKENNTVLRLNTNGHGNLINKRSIAGELVGLIDKVSVSLNVENAEKYNKICRPVYGAETYEKIKEFILECKKKLPEVKVTFIDMPGININNCRKVAEELNVGYRIRKLGIVG